MNYITLEVPGECVAQGRPRFSRRGNFVHTYDPEKSRKYKSLVAISAKQVMLGREMLIGKLAMSVEVYRMPPKSMSKKKRAEALAGKIRPVTRPDIDNYLKGIKDALNKVVYNDDSQIVEVTASKFYGDPARTIIFVKELRGYE